MYKAESTVRYFAILHTYTSYMSRFITGNTSNLYLAGGMIGFRTGITWYRVGHW